MSRGRAGIRSDRAALPVVFSGCVAGRTWLAPVPFVNGARMCDTGSGACCRSRVS